MWRGNSAEAHVRMLIISPNPTGAALAEFGICATLYGVFSRGLLTGSKPSGSSDMRQYLPRFTEDNAARNAAVVEQFRRFGAERGLTPGQLALAWVRAKQPAFLPLVGARNRVADGPGAVAARAPPRRPPKRCLRGR
jgi:hypothetical protein